MNPIPQAMELRSPDYVLHFLFSWRVTLILIFAIDLEFWYQRTESRREEKKPYFRKFEKSFQRTSEKEMREGIGKRKKWEKGVGKNGQGSKEGMTKWGWNGTKIGIWELLIKYIKSGRKGREKLRKGEEGMRGRSQEERISLSLTEWWNSSDELWCWNTKSEWFIDPLFVVKSDEWKTSVMHSLLSYLLHDHRKRSRRKQKEKEREEKCEEEKFEWCEWGENVANGSWLVSKMMCRC